MGTCSRGATCAREGRGSVSAVLGVSHFCTSDALPLPLASLQCVTGSDGVDSTNITEEHRSYASTRGELTSSFLLPEHPRKSLQEHTDHLLAENRAYAGFNLLLLAPRSASPSEALSFDATYVTNHGGGGKIACRQSTDEERRCGGLSNGVDGQGAEAWPKVRRGSELFTKIVDSVEPGTTETDLMQRLLHLLTCVPSVLIAPAWCQLTALLFPRKLAKRQPAARAFRTAEHHPDRALADSNSWFCRWHVLWHEALDGHSGAARRLSVVLREGHLDAGRARSADQKR